MEGGIELKTQHFDVVFHPNTPVDLAGGKQYVLGIRPEFVKVVKEGGIEGRVVSSLPTGMDTVLSLDTKGVTLSAVAFGSVDYAMDSIIRFTFEGDHFVLFDKETTEQIALGKLELRG